VNPVVIKYCLKVKKNTQGYGLVRLVNTEIKNIREIAENMITKNFLF